MPEQQQQQQAASNRSDDGPSRKNVDEDIKKQLVSGARAGEQRAE